MKIRNPKPTSSTMFNSACHWLSLCHMAKSQLKQWQTTMPSIFSFQKYFTFFHCMNPKATLSRFQTPEEQRTTSCWPMLLQKNSPFSLFRDYAFLLSVPGHCTVGFPQKLAKPKEMDETAQLATLAFCEDLPSSAKTGLSIRCATSLE